MTVTNTYNIRFVLIITIIIFFTFQKVFTTLYKGNQTKLLREH